MRLTATSRGAGIAGPSFDGVVHSVFPRAVNLAVGDGRLVGLVAAAIGNVPRGYRLDVPSGVDFTRLIVPGRSAHARGGILRIEGTEMSVDLRAAVPWSAHLAALALDPAKPGVARATATARRLLAGYARGGVFARLAREPIASLEAAMGQGDTFLASLAVRRLIGLGAGLTPAGDDFLVGVLAALWSGGAIDAAAGAFRAALTEDVRRVARATNDLSRLFLMAACEGEVSERLADAAAAIASGADDAVVETACRAALAVGASSGADALAGYLSAADALARRPRAAFMQPASS